MPQGLPGDAQAQALDALVAEMRAQLAEMRAQRDTWQGRMRFKMTPAGARAGIIPTLPIAYRLNGHCPALLAKGNLKSSLEWHRA
jgi:hypothetical protein